MTAPRFRPPPITDPCTNCGSRETVHSYTVYDLYKNIYLRQLHCKNCGELVYEWLDWSILSPSQ